MRVLWGNGLGGPGRRDKKGAFAAGALAVIAAMFIQYAWEHDTASLLREEGKEEAAISGAVTPSGPAEDSEKEEGQDRKLFGAKEGGGEKQTADGTAAAESGESPESQPDSSMALDGEEEMEAGSESASEEEKAGAGERPEEDSSKSGSGERRDGAGEGSEESRGGSGNGSGGSRSGSETGSEKRQEPGTRAADESEPSGGNRAPASRDGETTPAPAQYAVSDYGPGDLVGDDAVYALGSSPFFQETEISDSLFQRMYGKSYKEDCIIPREDLRYIRVLYYDFNGNRRYGELVSNKAISRDLVEIFQELYNQKYRIERIRLVDDYDADDDWSISENNTSCFNYRTVTGKSTLSLHARGLAIDINPRYNPNVFYDEAGNVTGCLPANGMDYTDRSLDFPHKIDENDLCVRLFKEHGFIWGGEWRREPDYMHFSRSSVPES